jgi:hypothetical protein
MIILAVDREKESEGKLEKNSMKGEKSCTYIQRVLSQSRGKTACVRNDQALAIFCRKDQPGFDLGRVEGIYFFCPPSVIFTPGSCQFFPFTPLLLVGHG